MCFFKYHRCFFSENLGFFRRVRRAQVRGKAAVFGGGLMAIMSMPFGPIGMAAGGIFGALARWPSRWPSVVWFHKQPMEL